MEDMKDRDDKIQKAKELLEYAIILENEKLIKVLVAINSSENKRMSDEEIKEITELNLETVVKSIELLDNTDYITTLIEDIPNRSLHKVYQLTQKGEKIIEFIESK